jgi:hypothetical protein
VSVTLWSEDVRFDRVEFASRGRVGLCSGMVLLADNRFGDRYEASGPVCKSWIRNGSALTVGMGRATAGSQYSRRELYPPSETLFFVPVCV